MRIGQRDIFQWTRRWAALDPARPTGGIQQIYLRYLGPASTGR